MAFLLTSWLGCWAMGLTTCCWALPTLVDVNIFVGVVTVVVRALLLEMTDGADGLLVFCVLLGSDATTEDADFSVIF